MICWQFQEVRLPNYWKKFIPSNSKQVLDQKIEKEWDCQQLEIQKKRTKKQWNLRGESHAILDCNEPLTEVRARH